MSKLHPYTDAVTINLAPLHWCHDTRPHSGTSLYMEWISTQPPIWRLPSIISSHQLKKPAGQLHIMLYITFAYILYMITLNNTSSARENGESVLFQPVLKAYPTCHPWLITAHISLGHLECHWKSFNRQMDRTHE